jgi:glyoxylate/hydroxypyruvate reductase A
MGDPAEVRYLAVWDAVEDLAERFRNLEVLFSTGAGVDQFDLSEIPERIQVVRLIDPAIIAGMREYVSFAVLAMHRNIHDYRNAQARHLWQPLAAKDAADVSVGVMGIGYLGQAVLDALGTFGYSLRAWSRTPHELDEIECFAGEGELHEFAGRCDILICLLPLTEQTRGVLNRKLFDVMPKASSLINVGRGGHLQEDDLLSALADGQLSAAVLDVTEEEPPAEDHPFWEHPGILLTPHIASATGADSAAAVILENIQRHERGERMVGTIDRSLAY